MKRRSPRRRSRSSRTSTFHRPSFSISRFSTSARSTSICIANPSCARISRAVCAYNAADTLEDCLSSLDNLTYPDFEVILVNDGSRDATGDIGRRHSRVRVTEVPNAGLSAARNVGLAEATGDILAYTDAD